MIGRRELAWIFIPFLALGVAIAVERIAAYDLGFQRGRDEIALLEMQADYPRGHLTRFGALAATGRDNFSISFPNDLNAVCLPLAYSASRAESREVSDFNYMPLPALSDFRVQPRSLSYYHSEQMIGLPGPIRLIDTPNGKVIENRTRLNLHNVLVTGPENATFQLGELGAGQSKALNDTSPQSSSAASQSELLGKLDPVPFLNILRDNPLKTPADTYAWRLTAWSDSMIEGVSISPETDRVRGFTLVLVHLRNGQTADFNSYFYNRLAAQTSTPQPVKTSNAIQQLIPNHLFMPGSKSFSKRPKSAIASLRGAIADQSTSNPISPSKSNTNSAISDSYPVVNPPPGTRP